MGNDGKAVVFSVSAPSGTFENGITAQTGTFSGSVSAGSFTTSGSFNVLGQTTFANASTTDLSISGNTYFPGGIWNSSGYVGIGTSNPLVKLQITDGDISLDTGRALYAMHMELADRDRSTQLGGRFIVRLLKLALSPQELELPQLPYR